MGPESDYDPAAVSLGTAWPTNNMMSQALAGSGRYSCARQFIIQLCRTFEWRYPRPATLSAYIVSIDPLACHLAPAPI
ncbi:hypothetical protein BS47DRAFT_1490661 [Hydnum rufescens UP504]|uniref:Uncharacterized protein n=1 Tax=Hydnum rufescens UP504 TaxID=1448309 RepID=A0A9P6DLL6_9AGAM|nr:hypothetical protein BS47DRAFT_1490661 [Hydnum rufescens UP504]